MKDSLAQDKDWPQGLVLLKVQKYTSKARWLPPEQPENVIFKKIS